MIGENNKVLGEIKKLKEKKNRDSSGRFIIESVRVFEEFASENTDFAAVFIYSRAPGLGEQVN